MIIDFSLRAIKKIAREIIFFITKCKNDRILLLHESSSGSNTYALMKLATEKIKKKYEIISYNDHEPTTFTDYIKKHALLASAKLIITTHASYKPGNKNIHLQLWHGPFIKKNGVMLQGDNKNMFSKKNAWRQADFIMSYSETYTTFLNACMVTDPNKYIVSGAPRNDLLYISDGKSNMKKIYGDKIDGYKVILFMPTFRDNYVEKDELNEIDRLFGFNEFSLEKFDKFLELNKCKLIFKPHPHSEALVLSYFNEFNLSNLLILRNEDLVENNLDLYELLNATDMLITDYSSVFYDYLLLDKHMIFAPTDITLYQQDRGFIIESFESWTPGPKVISQDDLQAEISKCLEDESYYGDKRAWLRDLNHRYKDGDSSKRLWNFIDSVMPDQVL